MARPLDYYFSLVSPWAYLGFKSFLDIAARHDLSVNYKPVALGAVFDQTGGLPLNRRHPARQRYRMMELQRWRERRGMNFHLNPRYWPFDATLADRSVIALVHAGADPSGYLTLAHAAVWEGQQDLAQENTLAALLTQAGHDPDAVLTAAQAGSTEVVHLLNMENAVEAGVFGAPAYVVDGEVFWGQDRLELLDAMLTSGRPAYHAAGAA